MPQRIAKIEPQRLYHGVDPSRHDVLKVGERNTAVILRLDLLSKENLRPLPFEPSNRYAAIFSGDESASISSRLFPFVSGSSAAVTANPSTLVMAAADSAAGSPFQCIK